MILLFNKIILTVLIALLFCACAKEGEQSITFHDGFLREEVSSQLLKKDIRFRRDGNTI